MTEERKKPVRPVPPFRPVDIRARVEIDARVPDKLRA
jgi:hypothetical protein